MGGGAANGTLNIAKELAAMGHSVHVLTSKLKGEASSEVLHGFTVYRVFSWRKGIHDCGMRGAYTYVLCAAFKLRALLKANDYEALHVFFSLPTGLLTLLPGKIKTIPYVVSLRGSDVPQYDPYNKKLQLFHSFLKPLTRLIWKRAKHVVALSEGLKKTALLSAPGQEIAVIGNGVETDLFKPSEKPRENDGLFKLIAVTRLIERKGVQHILEALKEINDPSIRLQIVGTGNYEKNLKLLAYDLKLNHQVDFYGYSLRSELPILYNQSDAFILPSMAESFGIVFAEAMACGLPVIAGRTGGVPDLIKEENGILVTPGSVREIKEAIRALQASAAKRSSMGKLNRERVLTYYSWKSVAEKYTEYYR